MARAQEAFDERGRLCEDRVAERLREHLARLVAEAVPEPLAA